VAGILHDVVCDTSESLKSIEEQFGDDVASLVSGVSKLSYINQVTSMLVKCVIEHRNNTLLTLLRNPSWLKYSRHMVLECNTLLKHANFHFSPLY
jgi:hypothetical protein